MIAIINATVACVLLTFCCALSALAADHQHGHVATSVVEASANKSTKNGVIGFDLWGENNKIHMVQATQQEGRKILSYHLSSDQGKSWEKISEILFAQNEIYSPARGSFPQIAAQGKRIAVLWSKPGNTRFGSGVLGAALSTDGGLTWTPAKNPSDLENSDSQNFMDLATDSKGKLIATWLDKRNNKQGLQMAYSDDFGATWKKNITLDDETCQCCWSKQLVLNNDDLAVLYRDISPRDMSLVTISEAGSKTSGATAVGKFGWDFKACPHKGGGLAYSTTNEKLRIHATVWTGKESQEGQYYLYSDDYGKTWSDLVKVGSSTSDNGDVAVADKKVMIVFKNNTENKLEFVMSKDAGLTFAKTKTLSLSKNFQKNPQVVTADKNFIVGWIEEAKVFSFKSKRF